MGYVDGLNLYEYGRGDPAGSLDPAGLRIRIQKGAGWRVNQSEDYYENLLRQFQGLCPCVEFSLGGELFPYARNRGFDPWERRNLTARRLRVGRRPDDTKEAFCDCVKANPGCELVYDLMRTPERTTVQTVVPNDDARSAPFTIETSVHVYEDPTFQEPGEELAGHDAIDILAHELTHAWITVYGFPGADNVIGHRPDGSNITAGEFFAVRVENMVAVSRGHRRRTHYAGIPVPNHDKPFPFSDGPCPCDAMWDALGSGWNPE